jgi:hypothetical protein
MDCCFAASERTVGIALWFAFNKEISGLFTKTSGENYTLILQEL